VDSGRGSGIALLVPFRDDNSATRGVNWAWLKRFWEAELPAANLSVGSDDGVPFSKACAINDAYRRCDNTCDVLVLLDADCYIDPSVILDCAERIREARRWRERVWFVPYRWLYRLTQATTARLIASDPTHALQFPTPPAPEDVTTTLGAAIGHRYGALIQIMPREAFQTIGGMDPRMRGWGGEDVTMVRVLDTLYGVHETTNNEVLTLYHLALGDVYLRKWEGQEDTGVNNALALRYRKMRRDPARMRAVVNEWLNDPQYAKHRIDAKEQ